MCGLYVSGKIGINDFFMRTTEMSSVADHGPSNNLQSNLSTDSTHTEMWRATVQYTIYLIYVYNQILLYQIELSGCGQSSIQNDYVRCHTVTHVFFDVSLGCILYILTIPSMCFFACVIVAYYQNCDCIFYHMLYLIVLSQK